MGDPEQGRDATDEQVLADAPAAVFVLVAGADGEMDQRERARYWEMLEVAASAPTGSPDAIAKLMAAAKGREHLLDTLDGVAAMALLTKVAAAADACLDAETSKRYRTGLLLMGERIASASGGGILGVLKRVDESESAALQELQRLLRL